jgi:hypothetical protein
MKRIPTVAILTLVLVCGLTTGAVFAQGSASGGIHVKDDAGQALNIEFTAKAGATGGDGVLTFGGTAAVSDPSDESLAKSPELVQLTLKVDLDCVVVQGNQAAMSGIVRDSSVDTYRGRRVVLAVEDGGEGSKAAPDKYALGIYGLHPVTWFPTDAELDFDDGWKFSWLATDAERPDDRGVPNTRSTDVDCHSFSLATYGYVDIAQGSGNVQVRP